MRIGELAAAVGVTPRTVRHYHQVGLLPEPARTASGYRDYTLRDLVLLSHTRRLVELGLSLDEARQTLAGDTGRDLADILSAMDADMEIQQRRLADQRRRLAELRERVRDGRLDVDDLPHPELVEFFSHVEAAGATGPMARLDRDMLGFLPGDAARGWVAPMLPLLRDDDYTRRLVEMYDAFDRLADAAPDAPVVAAFVDEFLDLLPEESRREIAAQDLAGIAGQSVMAAVFDELAPGQAAGARLMLERIVELSAEPARPDQARPDPEENR